MEAEEQAKNDARVKAENDARAKANTDQVINNSRANKPVVKKTLTLVEQKEYQEAFDKDRMETLDEALSVPEYDRSPEQRFIVLESLVAKLAAKVHGVV